MSEMRVLVRLNVSAARTTQTTIDGAMGYPKTPTDADRRGRGPHVRHIDARTEHYAQVVVHPTLGTVGVRLDASAEASLSPADRLLVQTADWFTGPS